MTGMNGKIRATFVTDWQFAAVLLALLSINPLPAALSGGGRGGGKKGGGIGGSGVAGFSLSRPGAL